MKIGKNNTKVIVLDNGWCVIEGLGTRNGAGGHTLTDVGRFDHLRRDMIMNCEGLFDRFLKFPLFTDME